MFKCKQCAGTEVIKICKPENVKFICIKGHVWHEEYIDKGGTHSRPMSYEVKLEQVLFPSEKALYKKVLREMEKNEWFKDSTPEEITLYLIDACGFNKEEVYNLFNKITKFSSK